MKKSYVTAIENYIVDSDGVYYNEIYDEFTDALTEEEIMDAIAELEDKGTIIYNERNEKYEVKLSVRKMKKSKNKVRKSLTVVKNGVRKARPIKKFQDSYYVGMAYVGLVELTKKGRVETGLRSDGMVINTRRYEAVTEKDSQFGKIYVDVSLEVEEQVAREDYGQRASGYAKYDDDYDGYTRENMSLWGENMAGMTVIQCSYYMRYRMRDMNGQVMELYSGGGSNYMSVEDALDALTADSEQAWGDVTIALNEYAERLNQYNQSASAFPDTVPVTLPNGNVLTLSKLEGYRGPREGHWQGHAEIKDDSANIECDYRVDIYAIIQDSDGRFSDDFSYSRVRDYYEVSRDSNVEYYAVSVTGTISDNNTQVNYHTNESPNPDSWQRVFNGQGAVTLEGAVAIAESNMAEVYQEFMDYIKSEREYVVQRNGTGRRRTTVNQNEWDYNYGDSLQDYYYENWQEELSGGYNGDDSNWDVGSYASDFEMEYLGDKRHLLYNRGDNPREFYPSSYADESKIEWVLANKTRENVESAARMVNAEIVDYTDPLHFTLRFPTKVRLSRRKSMRKSVRKPLPMNDSLNKMAKHNSIANQIDAIRNNNYNKINKMRK